MTESTIPKIDDSAQLREPTAVPDLQKESPLPRFRRLDVPAAKRRGPVDRRRHHPLRPGVEP